MIICVTNRILCRDDFLVRLEEIAAVGRGESSCGKILLLKESHLRR